MTQLRDYQLDAVKSIWADLFVHRDVLCVMPTGSGKTEIFTEVLAKSIGLKNDLKALVLMGRVRLVEQTARRVEHLGSVGVYCAKLGRKELGNQITVGSIQSLRGLHLEGINLVILDEVHNVGENGEYAKFIKRVSHDKIKIVGFTATPYRNDGYIYGEGKPFSHITYKCEMRYLIDQGFLVKPILKRGENDFETDGIMVRMGEFVSEQIEKLTKDQTKAELQVSEALLKTQDRKKIVWQCSSIAHADKIYQIIKEKEPASILHSGMMDEDRNDSINSFEFGSVRHLVFVSIVSEGYDYPPIDAVVLLCPTRSPTKYVQTVGRGLRPSEGKKDCLILDFGQIVRNLGPVDNPHIRKKGSKKDVEPIKMKFCKNCLEYCQISAVFCPACENPFQTKPRSSEKNLTHKPDEIADILFKEKRELIDIMDVRFSRHVSKAGNVCLKVVYVPKDFLKFDHIAEYFSTETEWGLDKMDLRLATMGIYSRPNLDKEINIKANKIPRQVDVKFEVKYPKVKRLVF